MDRALAEVRDVMFRALRESYDHPGTEGLCRVLLSLQHQMCWKGNRTAGDFLNGQERACTCVCCYCGDQQYWGDGNLQEPLKDKKKSDSSGVIRRKRWWLPRSSKEQAIPNGCHL